MRPGSLKAALGPPPRGPARVAPTPLLPVRRPLPPLPLLTAGTPRALSVETGTGHPRWGSQSFPLQDHPVLSVYPPTPRSVPLGTNQPPAKCTCLEGSVLLAGDEPIIEARRGAVVVEGGPGTTAGGRGLVRGPSGTLGESQPPAQCLALVSAFLAAPQ